MDKLEFFIENLLRGLNLEDTGIDWTKKIIFIVTIQLGIFVLTWIFRRFLIPLFQKLVGRTKAKWDDHLLHEKVLHRFIRLIPPLVWCIMIPVVFDNLPYWEDYLFRFAQIYFIVMVLFFVNAIMNKFYDLATMNQSLKTQSLKGVFQMMKLATACIGIILIISVLFGKNVVTIVAGLSASAAVLMLIFKDMILGLVAGVQLSANDMLRPGDWITMEKHGADGFVTEVSLTTVKIQNFDKTITTIPPYALVSDSFQNWRGMFDSGGRRIKRSLLIDAGTVRFCTPEECARFGEKEWFPVSDDGVQSPVNLTLFRRYVFDYLKKSPYIHTEFFCLVRMLQSTSEGIPLELYCFTKTTEWGAYEERQALIFDHLLAMLPEFGLRVYQRPSGADLQTYVSK